MAKPAETRPWLKSRLETSGRILRLIVSPSTTVGVKRIPTPNSLNSMVTRLFSCATGYGNSPPDRNFASRPLWVTRFRSDDRRGEEDPDAELLELDGDPVILLRDRVRELTAGQELRLAAAVGDQVPI